MNKLGPKQTISLNKCCGWMEEICENECNDVELQNSS